MRVWDIHPGYLSRQNLLGQHAEIHALFCVIDKRKKGYAAHPETLRWKDKLGRLRQKHDLTVLEMKLRRFNHASPLALCGDQETGAADCIDSLGEQVAVLGRKYRERNQGGRIPLPMNAFEFWAHHKYSVMARGYDHYKEIQALFRVKKRASLEEAEPLFGQIMAVMDMPVTAPALANVVDHLWGYFKKEASETEKEIYLNRKPEDPSSLIRFFYELAERYNRPYLLHSTIFADFTDQL